MRARPFLLILLALVLWGRGVRGRGRCNWTTTCTTWRQLDPARAHQGVLPLGPRRLDAAHGGPRPRSLRYPTLPFHTALRQLVQPSSRWPR